jgi:lipoprotein LprG
MTTARGTARTLAALTVVLGAVLSGCGGHSRVADMPSDQRLAAAKAALDKSPAVRITLKAESLPSSVSGVLSADGVGTHQPAFKGTISVTQNGLSLPVPIVSVDNVVYAQFGTWQKVDPSQYDAPDPATLMSPATGLSTLLTAATKLDAGAEKREGRNYVTTISGTLSGVAVARLIPSADKGADFRAAFSLDEDNHLTTARLTGPFYPKAGDITYTLTVSDYGSRETVTAP